MERERGCPEIRTPSREVPGRPTASASSSHYRMGCTQSAVTEALLRTRAAQGAAPPSVLHSCRGTEAGTHFLHPCSGCRAQHSLPSMPRRCHHLPGGDGSTVGKRAVCGLPWDGKSRNRKPFMGWGLGEGVMYLLFSPGCEAQHQRLPLQCSGLAEQDPSASSSFMSSGGLSWCPE